MRQWILAAVLAGFSAGAAAQGYIGVGLGGASYDDAEFFAIEDESTAFEALVGIRLIDVLAIEASYLNLGDFQDLENDVDLNFSGFTLSGKAILPLGPQMDFFAQVGAYFWELEEDDYYYGDTYLLEDGSDLIYGGGANFHLTDQFDLNLTYRAVELRDLETSLLSAGFSFVF